MSLHKLTAGAGYTYLTRQVAANDATARGFENLGEYYSEKGEAPGVWMGRGLSGVPESSVGEHVTEAQMVALFGAGRHPNAEQIERALRAAGASEKASAPGICRMRRCSPAAVTTRFGVCAPIRSRTSHQAAGQMRECGTVGVDEDILSEQTLGEGEAPCPNCGGRVVIAHQRLRSGGAEHVRQGPKCTRCPWQQMRERG